MADGELRCVIVTPEKTFCDEAVESVVVPAFDGEIGVRKSRAPVITRLGPGELRYAQAGKSVRVYVDGGFAQVQKNVVTILTPRAVRPEDLKVNDLEDQLQKANASSAVGDIKIADRSDRVRKLRAQIRIAKAK